MTASFRSLFQFQIRELIMLIALVSVLTASWVDLRRQRKEINQLEQRVIDLQGRFQPMTYW